MSRIRIAVAVTLLVAVVAGCGGTSDSDEPAASTTATSAVPIVSSSPPPPDTAGPDETLILAAYLADLYDLGADLVEAQTDQAIVTDPAQHAQLIESFTEDLRALDPPEEARSHHERSVELSVTLSSAMRELADRSAAGDPAENQRAAQEFLELFDDIGRTVAELDVEQAGLVASVFSAYPGDSEAAYWVEVLELQQGGGPIVEELFSALSVLGSDPEAAIDLMAELVGSLASTTDQWRALSPPPNLEDFHQRSIDGVEDYQRVFGVFVDAIEKGEEPPVSTVLELQDLGIEAQLQNADTSRLIAITLRRLSR